MSKFFNDTMQGLLEAIAIKNGDISVVEVEGMPAKTYRASSLASTNDAPDTVDKHEQETVAVTG